MRPSSCRQRLVRPSLPLGLILSLLVGGFVEAGSGRAENPAKNVLRLSAAEPEIGTPDADGGLLIREIMRQAVLLAAREEVGLATRDAVLGEFDPGKETASQVLDIGTRAIRRQVVAVTLRRGPREKPILLWQKEIPWPAVEPANYFQLIEAAEKLARTEWPAVLRQAGYQGEPPTQSQGAPASVNEKQLGQMTFASQFAVLRDLHAQAQTRRHDPVVLGGLIRAYAHLGQMTAFHWNASHKVFKARSLLYAERWVAREPASPQAHWHRAYARALAGFPGAALDSLAEAKKLAEASPTKAKASAPPAWVDLMEAFCRLDSARLLTTARDPKASAQLANFLNYLSLEAQGKNRVFILFTHKALAEFPEMYPLYAGLGSINGLETQSTATLGLLALEARLSDRLLEVPGLPSSVSDLARKGQGGLSPADVAAIGRELVRAGRPEVDHQEPSWSVLGRLVQEATFAQAHQTILCSRKTYGFPLDQVKATLRQLMPLIADHRYRDLVLSYGVDARRDSELHAALLKNLHLVDVEHSALPAITATVRFHTPGKIQGEGARRLRTRHWDATSDDLALFLERVVPAGKARLARRLLRVSPYSPAPAVALIEHDWDYAGPRAGEWEQRYRAMPTVLLALGRKYSALNRYADAERCLRASLRMSPDASAYALLATNYRAQGDLIRWQETLDDFLKTPEDGLTHARVRVNLADYFMERGEWTKAKPYADAAAESGAGWAMMCAHRCYEGLRDWDAAEHWVRETSERYEDSACRWYFWCMRTGKGAVAEARRLAAQRVESLRGTKNAASLARAATYYELTKQRDDAWAAYRSAFRQAPADLHLALHVALLAHEQGLTKERAEAFRAVAAWITHPGPVPDERAHAARQSLQELGALLAQALAEERGQLDLPAVDRILKKAASDVRVDMNYFVARCLELRGKHTEARRYLTAAAESGMADRLSCILAGYRLRQNGSGSSGR